MALLSIHISGSSTLLASGMVNVQLLLIVISCRLSCIFGCFRSFEVRFGSFQVI